MKTRYFILCITALALFLVFRYMLPLVLPFAFAYFFAKSVSPLIHFLTSRLKWHKKVSSILVVVVIVLAISGFVIYIASIAIGQAILLLQKIPVYQQLINSALEKICCHCDQMLELSVGTSYHYIEARTAVLYRDIETEMIPKLSSYAFGFLQWTVRAGSGIFIFILSTLLILLDDSFPAVHRKIKPIALKLKYAGLAYIKAQVIIIFIIASVVSAGLFLIGNEYAVLFGIGIAVFDAFPIVGSGIVLVPWAILKIIGGNFYDAAILFTVFLITTFLHEILEPRLLGKKIGIKPLFVLISIYMGIELFSIGGIVLGPVSLTILKAVNERIKEKSGKREKKESPEQ